MPWPMSLDYHEAVQTPSRCFEDADLKAGQTVCNALGLPVPYSGNFADVYAVESGPRKWAVKCFTREVPGLQERYARISRYLNEMSLPFMVEFQFLEKGIRIRTDWYPILKMQWVEGFNLNAFVRDNLDKPQLLQGLCEIWLRLAARLREATLAHCDLQHGNVLLVPGAKAGMLSLRLVDYDGTCVPGMEQLKSNELGHAAYQHPQRLREGTYGLETDRFALLAIYTALRALSVDGKPLWDKYNNGDNLLFKQPDFAAPGESAIFRELSQSKDAEVQKLVKALAEAAQKPIGQVPLLEDLLAPPKPAPKVEPAAPKSSPRIEAPGPKSSPRIEAPAPKPASVSETIPTPARRSKAAGQGPGRARVWVVGGLCLALLIGFGALWGFGVFSGPKPQAREEPKRKEERPPEPEVTLRVLLDGLAEGEPKRSNSLGGLVKRGKAGVPELVEALKEPKPPVRLGVVRALELLGADARGAVPALAQSLSDDDDQVARAAVSALQRIGSPSKAEAPALASALKSNEAVVRLYAVETLAGLKPEDRKAALAGLIGALDDVDFRVAMAAGAALKDMAMSAADVPVLATVSKDGKVRAHDHALAALLALGPMAKAAVPILSAALKDADPAKASFAAQGLAQIGSNARDAVPDLIAASQTGDEGVRRASLEALIAIGKTPATVARLFAALEEDDGELAKVAGPGLEKLAPLNADAVPTLLTSLKGKKAATRAQALKAIVAMGAAAHDTVPALIDALQDKDAAGRVEVIGAIGAVGPEATAAVRPLADLLHDKDETVRLAAANALGRIGPKAVEAVPGLAKMLGEEKNAEVRNAAATALGGIGPEARDASPQLIVALKNKPTRDAASAALVKIGKRAVGPLKNELEKTNGDPTVRECALVILGDIGPDAQDAVEAMNKVLANDRFPAVQRAGKDALKKIQTKP